MYRWISFSNVLLQTHQMHEPNLEYLHLLSSSIPPRSETQAFSLTHTHTHKHAHSHSQTLSLTHTYKHTHTLSPANINTHTHTHTLTLTHIVHDPAVKVVQSRAVSAMLSNSAVEPSFRSLIASTMGGESKLYCQQTFCVMLKLNGEILKGRAEY